MSGLHSVTNLRVDACCSIPENWCGMPVRDGNFSSILQRPNNVTTRNTTKTHCVQEAAYAGMIVFLVPILMDTGKVAAVIAAFARHMRCCGVLAMARVRI